MYIPACCVAPAELVVSGNHVVYPALTGCTSAQLSSKHVGITTDREGEREGREREEDRVNKNTRTHPFSLPSALSISFPWL